MQITKVDTMKWRFNLSISLVLIVCGSTFQSNQSSTKESSGWRCHLHIDQTHLRLYRSTSTLVSHDLMG